MKTAIVLGVAVFAFNLFACSAGEEEKTGSSDDQLSVSCITQIKAPPGSAAYRAALQQCLAEDDDVGGGQGGGWGGQNGGQGGGQSCTQGIQCVNGACECTSGPAKGQACDGTTVTGASSCSVLCRSCN